MATRQLKTIPPAQTGLTVDQAASVMTAQQRAELAFRTPDEVPEESEDFEQTPADRIEMMLADYAESARSVVKVSRVVGPNKYAWCKDYTVQDYEAGGFEMIRNEWGAGEYEIRLYATSPQDKFYCVRGKLNIHIEAAKNAPAPTVAQAPQNSELSQVLQTLAQGQQQMLQALTERPAAPDPMAQMGMMFGLMTQMREAMGLTNQAPQKSSVMEAMEMVREMRAVAAELVPEKEPQSDSLMSLLPGVLEMIKSGALQQQQQQVLPTLQAPAIRRQEQPAPNIDQQEALKMNMLAELKKHVTALIERAAIAATHTDEDDKTAAVEDAAEVVYDHIPDEGLAILQSEEWFDALMFVEPQVKPHQEWLTKVRNEVLKMIAEDAQDTSDASPQGLVNPVVS